MKELSIEEKARAYDKSLEKAKEFKNNPFAGYDGTDLISALFPELTEPDDERIRKVLLNNFKNNYSEYCCNDVNRDMIIAWLEKQGKNPVCKVKIGETYKCIASPRYTCFRIGDICYVKDNFVAELINICSGCFELLEKQSEQKTTDKDEPKFHQGEWITNGDYTWQIISVTDLDYILRTQDGNIVDDTISYVDEQFHSFTIQDAKEGDVLACDDKDKVFLYNGKLDLRDRVCAYCGIYKTYDGLRFTKCAIGNYFTYKEPYPATKEQRDLLFQKMKEEGYEWDAEKKELKKIEQTPSWSEEDELNIRELERLVKQVWATAEHENDKDTIHKMSDLSFFLKTLKPQPKQEWSEDDEYYYNIILYILNNECVGKTDKEEAINWYRSIKDRVQPHSQWRPSDEQITWLYRATDDASKDSRMKQVLEKLLSDLKKLREE